MSMTRRTLLVGAVSGGLAGAASLSMPFAQAQTASRPRVLTACFSRTGNTATIASYVQRFAGGDRFNIVPAAAYPRDYEATVAQAQRERDSNYRPPLQMKMADITAYNVVLLGFPIWAMTLPPVMRTFLDEHDLTGKTIAPFCTHKGYGRGRSVELIAQSAPSARLLDPFDVEGVNAGSARRAVERWLRGIGLERT